MKQTLTDGQSIERDAKRGCEIMGREGHSGWEVEVRFDHDTSPQYPERKAPSRNEAIKIDREVATMHQSSRIPGRMVAAPHDASFTESRWPSGVRLFIYDDPRALEPGGRAAAPDSRRIAHAAPVQHGHWRAPSIRCSWLISVMCRSTPSI